MGTLSPSFTSNFRLDQLDEMAIKVLSYTSISNKIFLSGDLGAGKTTFVSACCKALKCTDTVQSPTFSIHNSYPTPSGIINHLDLYRLSDYQEFFMTGLEEILYKKELIFVEWPAILEGHFEETFISVKLEVIDARNRSLHLEVKGSL